MGLLVALSLGACGDDKGDTGDGTGTDPTTDPSTDPSTDPTTDPGPTTSGDPTSGTTEDPTEDTVDTADPETQMQCLDNFATGAKIVDEQCKCAVMDGVFPDVASCVAEVGTSQAEVECTCGLYGGYPEAKAGLECAKAPQEAFVACLGAASCDPEKLGPCFDAYFTAVEDCPPLTKPLDAAVQIECKGEPAFMCGSGEAIPDYWKCDTSIDCADETDESTCPGAMKCADGSGYYPELYKCDGEADCMDGSDEAGCPTFMCMDGTTIPEKFKCDGGQDCRDGSDEVGCPVFMCMDGTEIPEAWKCDGFEDCMMGEDEAMCP
jgi:hypothetical protein